MVEHWDLELTGRVGSVIGITSCNSIREDINGPEDSQVC
jgi:hypothetical protein